MILAFATAAFVVGTSAEPDLDDLHERVHANVVPDHEKAAKGKLDVGIDQKNLRPTPKHKGEVFIRLVTPDQREIGYFKSMKTEVYPNEDEYPFISQVSFVFDTVIHAHKWVRSTVLTNATPEGYLPMSIAIREGSPDERGYISRAARVLTTTEEIDSVAWILGSLGEDSFLDSSSEFDWTECPIRGWEEDRDASRAVLRDCAILAVQRGHVYDKDGEIIPAPTDKPKVKKAAKEDMTKKLQQFLEKNRQRKGKLDVEMIIKEKDDDGWLKTTFKFLFLLAMVVLGAWLYKKKKDMDLRSEKII